MSLQNRVFTYILTASTIVIQEGAKQIYLKNTGAGNATWTGDKSNASQPSTAVTLGVAGDFTFASNGQGYGAITIDASATVVEIVAIY